MTQIFPQNLGGHCVSFWWYSFGFPGAGLGLYFDSMREFLWEGPVWDLGSPMSWRHKKRNIFLEATWIPI